VAEAEREGSLILLADDHPTNRAVIARQINQLGYACESANDGEAAWTLWKSGRFALLMTDLHMPRRDGYALAAAVRADEQRSGRARAPVIALSATVNAEGVERSRVAGIDDFLAKPAPLAVLASALHRYLPLQHFATQAAPTAAASPNPVPDRELLDDFLRSTREDLAALHAALASGDAAAVAREAHRIKGASGLIDATALAACAARVEAAARANDLDPVKAGVIELEAEVKRFAAAHGIS
jgi:CheY-like chemotaxis protein/HPt (histidine-containing phosphotransfer) domain-containing protein